MTELDIKEQIARIDRAQAETQKFAEEALKLGAEMRKLTRDVAIAPWQLTAASFGTGAAVVAAIATLLKVI